MKKLLMYFAAISMSTGIIFAFIGTPKHEWALDKSHSKLGFSVSHMMISEVDGRFNNFEAKIVGEYDDFSDAVATMTAQVSSVNTDNDKRDEDLRGPNYFDTKKYPTLSFKSSSFKKLDDRNYKVIGDLTIHGITKQVELNAFVRTGDNPMTKKAIAGFRVTGKINRLDFGVGLSAPTTIVGNEVDLIANVEFAKSPMP